MGLHVRVELPLQSRRRDDIGSNERLAIDRFVVFEEVDDVVGLVEGS